MYKGGSKLIPIALVVIVTIVAIIALVSVGRALLGGGADEGDVTEENPAARALLSTEIDRSVRMTVRGPIIADEEFNSYQIEISPVERRMTTYRGYGEEVIENKQLDNTTEGYEEFVYALDRAHFAKDAQQADMSDDVRGICATGRLYTFALLQAQSVVKELWVSSCRNEQGTFKGEAASIRDLFQKQIPDSRTLLRNLNL